MEIRFSLPSVDLSKQDIEWLERDILGLLKEPKPDFQVSEISVSIGKGPDKMDLEDISVERLLQSAFLRKTVNSLQFSFGAEYENPKQDSRRIDIVFDANDRTEVRLEGPDTWVHSARDNISAYLEGKTNRNRWLRLGSIALIWLLPTIALVIVAFYRPSALANTFILIPVLWTLGGGIVAGRAIGERMYPLSNITLDAQVRRPWYTVRAHELLGGFIVAIVAGVVVTLLFH